jgi:hypothetical protein
MGVAPSPLWLKHACLITTWGPGGRSHAASARRPCSVTPSRAASPQCHPWRCPHTSCSPAATHRRPRGAAAAFCHSRSCCKSHATSQSTTPRRNRFFRKVPLPRQPCRCGGHTTETPPSPPGSMPRSCLPPFLFRSSCCLSLGNSLSTRCCKCLRMRQGLLLDSTLCLRLSEGLRGSERLHLLLHAPATPTSRCNESARWTHREACICQSTLELQQPGRSCLRGERFCSYRPARWSRHVLLLHYHSCRCPLRRDLRL